MVKGFGVFLLGFSAHVAAGGKDVAVFLNLFQFGGFAEAGDVFVFAGLLLPPPGVIGVGDFLDVFVRQFPVGAVHHAAHFAGVDKKNLAAAVPVAAVPLVPGQEPEARRNWGGIEQLPR